MPIPYFAGTADFEFVKEGSDHVVNTATTAARRTANCRSSQQVNGNVSRLVAPLFTELDGSPLSYPSAFFAQQFGYFTQSGGALNYDHPIILLRRSGTPYLRVALTDAVPRLEVFTSGAWSTLATGSQALLMVTLQRLKIQVVVHPTTGLFRFWEEGVLRVEATNVNTQGDNPGTTIDALALAGGQGGATQGVAWSEVIVSDEDPHDYVAAEDHVTAAGDVNTMTSGTFADIDETTESSADVISGTTNQEILVNTQNLPSGTLVPACHIVTARARTTDGSPPNAQLSVKHSGTTNYSANKAMPATFASPSLTRPMAINPVTSVPWTRADIDALQIGIKFVA